MDIFENISRDIENNYKNLLIFNQELIQNLQNASDDAIRPLMPLLKAFEQKTKYEMYDKNDTQNYEKVYDPYNE
jgi:hypothetical protein